MRKIFERLPREMSKAFVALNQYLKLILRLGIATENQFPPVGRWKMHVHQLQGDLDAVSQKADEDMRLDPDTCCRLRPPKGWAKPTLWRRRPVLE